MLLPDLLRLCPLVQHLADTQLLFRLAISKIKEDTIYDRDKKIYMRDKTLYALCWIGGSTEYYICYTPQQAPPKQDYDSRH